MKKKVAVYANGCAYEYSGTIISGIEKAAKEADVDLYIFLNFVSAAETEEDNKGELNIYSLADMSEFDGILLLANQFNSTEVVEYFRQYILDNQFCCVSLECDLEGIHSVLTDNSVGMYDVTNHLIEEHDVREIVYVSGPSDLPENIERRAGVERAMEEHGLSLDEEHVIPGMWSFYSGRDGVLKWMEAHDNHLPDAFIGANDYMCMGVCSGLKKLGFEVPRDVRVAGYDNLLEARTFSPGITSVNRNSYEVGYRGMNSLLALMNGEPEEQHMELVQSKLAVEESCGCFNLLKNAQVRNAAYNDTFLGNMDTIDFTRRARVLESKMIELDEKEELYTYMEEFFQMDAYLEHCNMAVMLDDRFLASVYDPSLSLRSWEYSETVDVLYCQKGDEVVRLDEIKAHDLLPDIFLGEERVTHFFLPLHSREKNLGYVVFSSCTEKIGEALLYSWMNSMYQLFANVHKDMQLANMNKKLYEASVTDIQTGLLNRTGYNREVIPFLVEHHDKEESCVVILVDINRMKRINDVYGHLQGDMAIAIIGESIRHCIPKDWLGVRYGGDEFLIAGVCEKKEQAEDLIQKLEEMVSNKNVTLRLPFKLMVSCGYTMISSKEEFALDELIHRADEMMYVDKQAKHAVD